MILPCEHPAAGSVRKWKALLFAFQGASAPSSAPTSLDARVPIQFFGLAFADHGQRRAALDEARYAHGIAVADRGVNGHSRLSYYPLAHWQVAVAVDRGFGQSG